MPPTRRKIWGLVVHHFIIAILVSVFPSAVSSFYAPIFPNLDHFSVFVY